MRRIIGILLLIMDLTILPALLAYYILLSMDLMYGCAMDKGNFKMEFKDFNKQVKDNIIDRIETHKERILEV